MNDSEVDLSAALQSLPHGPEFRFVDRLLSLAPGKEAVAEYQLREGEPFLRGHFPGQPLMPGVLLIEAGAQLAGIVAQTDPDTGPSPELKLTAVHSAKITGSARPGETIRIAARITGRLGQLIQGEVEVTLNGSPLLIATLVLSAGSR